MHIHFSVLILSCNMTTSLRHYGNNYNNTDLIEAKLNSFGLKIPQPLKVPPNIKTPSAWVRLMRIVNIAKSILKDKGF
jgi:hypothetical protein